MKLRFVSLVFGYFVIFCLVGCGGSENSKGTIDPTPEQKKSMIEGMEKYQKKAK